MIEISLKVNGKNYVLDVDEEKRLLDILREDLGFTSVKEGCSEGECGACTVIMNGKTAPSCLVMAFQADGSEIITLEGLIENGEINFIQRAFMEVGAVQCGYCTPGFILSAKALLDKNPSPTREEIREAIAGNLCRCTGYSKIVDAIEKASKEVSAK
ncbi:2Fe-2S iron-sulfur cluster-binding protein [Caldanaerobacter subterraneus]|uniref:(2Fe-2S)-binding protein n=1 Tax=Caldanaerobacter subterraneus TaxID=911092 RepID=A0A7Y2PLS8_9THEO|nr:(2Fe-2S)-binding protein [Caldanaerobacter subterraneus]